ncbi:hypothetical protein B0H63DRAFT_524809 [Podospora didyma]|uniref:Uncharacterized protein n=1 Tax=Podospora didyma TaxID=330526 RepID=A0AAE0KK57_9PEZI|nr:hypothetical protein B0H63DRAFT_524809 [Podospora didyma]
MIFTHVRGEVNKADRPCHPYLKDLLSLAKTCKLFLVVVRPVLYQHIHRGTVNFFRDNADWDEYRCASALYRRYHQHPRPPLPPPTRDYCDFTDAPQLMRTFIETPGTSSMVESLRLQLLGKEVDAWYEALRAFPERVTFPRLSALFLIPVTNNLKFKFNIYTIRERNRVTNLRDVADLLAAASNLKEMRIAQMRRLFPSSSETRIVVAAEQPDVALRELGYTAQCWDCYTGSRTDSPVDMISHFAPACLGEGSSLGGVATFAAFTALKMLTINCGNLAYPGIRLMDTLVLVSNTSEGQGGSSEAEGKGRRCLKDLADTDIPKFLEACGVALYFGNMAHMRKVVTNRFWEWEFVDGLTADLNNPDPFYKIGGDESCHHEKEIAETPPAHRVDDAIHPTHSSIANRQSASPSPAVSAETYQHPTETPRSDLMSAVAIEAILRFLTMKRLRSGAVAP